MGAQNFSALINIALNLTYNKLFNHRVSSIIGLKKLEMSN